MLITLYLICISLILFSYVGYPLSLIILRIAHKRIYKPYTTTEDLPTIDIIISVRNESTVIEKKIHSLFHTSYPIEKITVTVISDASTDETDEILQQLVKNYPSLYIHINKERKGKPENVNSLAQQSRSAVLVLTDANVFFEFDTLFNLIKPFADKRIGLCGAVIRNSIQTTKGIAEQEKSYIQLETKIKQLEGECFGSMIGPFGGCYALRRELFRPVPDNNPVDDFYIGMSVLALRKDAILVEDAICVEDVPDDIRQEIKRKRRIANGNFKNFIYFIHLLTPSHPYTAYAFFSHKIIRWFTPILYLLSLIPLTLLVINKQFVAIAILQLFLWFAVIIDLILIKRNIPTGPVRFITYFCQMNIALLLGFIDFLNGKKAHIWEPTQRSKS